MWLQSRFFDLNFYFIVPYISERLKSECDFTIEAENSDRTKASVEAEPSLRDSVYIPKIYKDLSTKRVMVAEWIDGVKLWDREAISGPWRGEDMVGKPIGRRKAKKETKSMGQEFTSLFESSDKVKPEDYTVRRAGLGVSPKDVMSTSMYFRLIAGQNDNSDKSYAQSSSSLLARCFIGDMCIVIPIQEIFCKYRQSVIFELS
jgi:aarF domain-containing kinase